MTLNRKRKEKKKNPASCINRETLEERGKVVDFNTIDDTFSQLFLLRGLCIFILYWAPQMTQPMLSGWHPGTGGPRLVSYTQVPVFSTLLFVAESGNNVWLSELWHLALKVPGCSR